MVQKLTGLVLRTTEYKESDLILNILTREQGLISAKARAVRTNRSHNKGACQLLCYSEFTITDYKGFSAISEANAIEMFPELRSGYRAFVAGKLFCTGGGGFIAGGRGQTAKCCR